MKKLVLIFCLLAQTFAYTYNDIVNAIKIVASTQGVKPEILYTIVKIESDFKPFAISFLTNKANADYFKSLQTPNIHITTSNYSLNRTKWVVAINTNNEEYAKSIAKALINDGYNIDVGLGQLNSVNFSHDEIEYIFNPVYNLTQCSKVLRRCFNAKQKDIKNTIECYNYGMRRRESNPYFKKFYEHYKNFFGDPYK